MKKYYLIAILAGIITITFYRIVLINKQYAPFPVVKFINWSMLSQNSILLKNNIFFTKIIVSNFMFSNCSSFCIKGVLDLKSIITKLKKINNNKIYFLSFSLDYLNDNNKLLKRYIYNKKIKEKYWYIVEGSKSRIFNLYLKNINKKIFFLKERKKNYNNKLTNLSTFLLFDKNGEIRDFFPKKIHELSALVRSIKFLGNK